jgi:hypothetical protein
MVYCGKANCHSCPHGPYLYEYWKEGGKVHKRYLGKAKSSEIDTTNQNAHREAQVTQPEFDELVYQKYLEIRDRPQQPVLLKRVWQEVHKKKDVSWKDFSKMILTSQDPRFHLAEGKADKFVEDKPANRYYSNLIGK